MSLSIPYSLPVSASFVRLETIRKNIMKKVLLLVFVLIFSASAFAQTASKTTFDLNDYGVRVEPDKRLITVLASLEAAGLSETPLAPTGAKFRERVQTDVQSLPLEFRQKVKIFLDQYKRRHPNLSTDALLAPFISMAYSLAPAPELSDPARTTDLPGDLLEVLDYAPLAREFYRRMTAAKIDEYAKIYQAEADANLRRSANQMVGELLDYLHTKPQLTIVERKKVSTTNAKGKQALQKTEIRERPRRFFIVPEMLAPKGTVNFLNVGDDYFAVVAPDTDLSKSEARRAFLQFTLDPLVLTNAKEISAANESIKKLLAELKQSSFEREKTANKNASLEDVSVSPDVFLAVSRSLVAAADARQIEFTKTQIATAQARRSIEATKTDDDKRKVSARLAAYKNSLSDETALQLSEAYDKGAVLAFYFNDQLKALEDSGFDIASSFREMILSLDASKETNRYAQFADARKRATAARATVKRIPGVGLQTDDMTSGGAAFTIENPTTKKLLDIEKIIQAKNYALAEAELKKILNNNSPDTPRVYYALGRNASLSAELITDVDARNARLLDAKVAYENVIRSASQDTDRELISLSYVALGRIFEYDSQDDYAVKLYDAAIKIADANGEAYKQAAAARTRLLKKQ